MVTQATLATASQSYGVATGGKPKLVQARHPEWVERAEDWVRWRLCYEGGKDYIKANLHKYSRRETDRDFEQRERLTYNPADATQGVDVFRNSLMSKLHEVQRKGDARYLESMNNDVDLKGNSMGLFMGLDVAPLLMAVGRRFVCVDSPAYDYNATADEAKGQPYCWAINPEDIVTWNVDDETDELVAALISESYEIVDPDLGVVTKCGHRWRFMRLLASGTTWTSPASRKYKIPATVLTTPTDRAQVLLRLLDDNNQDMQVPKLIDIPRLPLILGLLRQALLRDVERVQRASLQLCSTDMSFLYRSNFPQQVRQVDTTKRSLRAASSKRPTGINNETELINKTVEDEEFRERSEVGPNRALVFGKDMIAPGYIAPPTDNCKLSMAKQEKMSEQIKIMLDQGMVSIGLKQVQQSGESKRMDRLGVDTGLAVVGKVMEGMEKEIAEVWHLFLKSGTDQAIAYPKDYAIKSADERQAETQRLQDIKLSVRSETFQKSVEKQQVYTMMQGTDTQADIDTAVKEVQSAPWIDFNVARAAVVQADVAAGMCSKGFGSELRGYPKGEADEAQAEVIAHANALSGGEVTPAGPGGAPADAKPGDGLPEVTPPVAPEKPDLSQDPGPVEVK